MTIKISSYVSNWSSSLFRDFEGTPWQATSDAPEIINSAIEKLAAGYNVSGDIAIHSTATVEKNAVLKGPLIIGPNTFIAAAAYLRGGVFIDENCIVGPSCELKTTFMFRDLRYIKRYDPNAFNFTITGSQANLMSAKGAKADTRNSQLVPN